MIHLECESRRNNRFFGLILTSPLLLAGLPFFACNPIEATRVDDCLDRGGSYNYETDVCDFEENHPVP